MTRPARLAAGRPLPTLPAKRGGEFVNRPRARRLMNAPARPWVNGAGRTPRWPDKKLARRAAWPLTVLPLGASSHDRHPSLDATRRRCLVDGKMGLVVGV